MSKVKDEVEFSLNRKPYKLMFIGASQTENNGEITGSPERFVLKPYQSSSITISNKEAYDILNHLNEKERLLNQVKDIEGDLSYKIVNILQDKLTESRRDLK